MKISIQAMLNFGSKGADKVKALTDRIRENLERASVSANRIDKGMLVAGDMNAGPSQGRTYRGQRGVTGARGAEGRDFAGLAGLAREETGGFVAAYATIAANLFAVTAAFQALSNAARTEQLAKGLELVGARAGVALPPVAKSLQTLTDNALSYAEAMKVVAQATAAGFKQDEIERLTKVARGASVALGRDMTDSIDRLTRGTIKLEPELLDEIGIMTRLDEAVREYASSQGRAVSSLTQTERRQAFLNSVLAEGERKFGDVSEQISANPYDKLQASLRDLGTGFLSFLNSALSPVAKLLADMPGLAIIPLIGILTTAASKVLPNLANAYTKVSDSVDIFKQKVEASKEFIVRANSEVYASFARIIDLDNAGAFKGTNLNAGDIADSVSDRDEIQSAVTRVEAEINRLKREGLNLNEKQIRQLYQVREELKDALGYQKAITTEKKLQKNYEEDEMIQRSMRNRIESVGAELNQGNVLSALSLTFGELGNDIKNTWTSVAAGEGAARKSFKKLGASVVTTGRLIGSIATQLGGWFAAIGVGIQLAITLYENWGTGAEKAYRKANKELGEYTKNLKETNRQMIMMLRLGQEQRGMALDALNNSLSETIDKLQDIELRMKEMEANRTDLAYFGNLIAQSYTIPALAVGKFLRDEKKKFDATFAGQLVKTTGITKNQAAVLQEQLNIIEVINKEDAARLRIALSSANSFSDQVDIMEGYQKATRTVANLYKDMAESSQKVATETSKFLTLDIKTPYSDLAASIEESLRTIQLAQDPRAIAESMVSASDLSVIAAQAKQLDIITIQQRDSLDQLVSKKKEVEQITAKINQLEQEYSKTLDANLKFQIDSLKVYKEILDTALGVSLKAQAAIIGLVSKETEKRYLNVEAQKVISQELVKQKEAETELASLANDRLKTEREFRMKVVGQGISNSLDPRIEAQIELKNRQDILKNVRLENSAKLFAADQARKLRQAEITDEKTRIQLANDNGKLSTAAFNAKMLALTTEETYLDNNYNRELELANAKESYALRDIEMQKKISESLEGDLAIEERSLKVKEKKLERDREILNLQKSLAAEQRTSTELDTETRFRSLRRSIPLDTLKKQEVTALRDEIKFADLEHKLALEEHDLKMRQIKLEFDVASAMLDVAESITGKKFDSVRNEIAEGRAAVSDKYGPDRKKLIEDIFVQQMSNMNKRLLLASESSIDGSVRQLETVRNDRRANLGGEALMAITPESMRGYMGQAAESAGGWENLINDPAALEKITAISRELGALDIVGKGLMDTYDAFANGMTEAFTSIIDGSKSAKQAFADLAIGMLKAIADMIGKIIAFTITAMLMDALMPAWVKGFLTLMGGGAGMVPSPINANANVSAGAAGGIIPLANGGIMDRSMGLQGVVKRPTYLVGEGRYNEAVVPLPNGRAIPVQMHGGAGMNNNVQVNVNISNEGNVQTETQGEDFNQLGGMIAAMINKKLQEEKMPGGILNKYGAS